MQGASKNQRSAAGFLTAIVLVVAGVVLGLGVAGWVGHPVLGAQRTEPVPVAYSGRAVPTPSDVGMGYAAILKPDLAAVVNISSSKIIKNPNQGSPFGPMFNDPFFQQFFGGQMPQMPKQEREHSLGSGVIFKPNGYILTNNHVVQGATEIKVALPDKREFTGKVVGTDPKTDIAVVKIDATDLPTIPLGDSSTLQVGDLAFAIGDPFGIGETATMGIVSATGRNGLDIEDYEDFIQTDASINPGNSGGALVNVHGQLIGINTAILAGNGGGNQGIGFAIPIDLARRIMDQILTTGKVVRGYLGVTIQAVTPDLAKAFHVPSEKGALIGGVSPGGPADKAGLLQGDVIEQVNGKPVETTNDLRLQIASMAPGTEVHLEISRAGQEREVSLKLGELPENAASAGAPGIGEGSPMSGVQVDNLTPSIARQLGIQPGTKGVVVTDVPQTSAAADAGLQRGDVIEQINRQDVTNVNEYQRLVREAGKQAIVLLINHGGQTAFIVVQPE